MRKVVVVNHLTLDGVMQAPARPDEDRRDGFAHGGWSVPYGDAVMGAELGQGRGREGALLLGRRTYEDFAAVWPDRQDNPFTEGGEMAAFRLADIKPTTTGVIIATYQPAGPTAGPDA
jgi:hypothetical protein